jgi:hypothetical protein
VSVDARGAIRWQRHVGEGSPTQILAGVRIPGERGDVLTVGSQCGWGRLAGPVDAEAPLEQGKFEIEGADPTRTLDAIVALGHDMGFIALGRAKRERVQAHDQVIAVGFDRAGQPTWTRLLDHFRAMQIYGGAVTRDSQRGAVRGTHPDRRRRAQRAGLDQDVRRRRSDPRRVSSRTRWAGRAPGSSKDAWMRRSPRTQRQRSIE